MKTIAKMCLVWLVVCVIAVTAAAAPKKPPGDNATHTLPSITFDHKGYDVLASAMYSVYLPEPAAKATQVFGGVDSQVWSAKYVLDIAGRDYIMVIGRDIGTIKNFAGTGDWRLQLIFPADNPGESIGFSASKTHRIADNLDVEGGLFVKVTAGKPVGGGPYISFTLRL